MNGGEDKYLLYLDILGFSEMVKDSERVFSLYKIINALNVHSHDVFECIVFSDTLLVYNHEDPKSDRDRRYLVMFLIEFAQDLLCRLIGRDTYFRAVLTKGSFWHDRMENLDSYFGEALVRAHRDEKKLIGCGLFIDRRLNKYNKIFDTAKHNAAYDYVFVTQNIQSASEYGRGGFPFPGELLDSTTMNFDTYAELIFLRDIYLNSISHEDPKVRGKFQATWVHYQQQYKELCDALYAADFDFDAVTKANWQEAKVFFEKELAS